jgi:hypothetical protein
VSSSGDEAIAKQLRNKAGHLEIIGETYAKLAFFEQGWNPYSRFLDVDKVDFLLRRVIDGRRVYREVQVKYGKLYDVGGAARRLFDVTSWRFFKRGEFADQALQDDFFVAYVLARVRVCLSQGKGDGEKWFLRKTAGGFDEINDDTCLDVSSYHRSFDRLLPPVAR